MFLLYLSKSNNKKYITFILEESSKLESQPRQKPKAKFRDSFILDTKDEGLYSTFEENEFTDPNEITSLRSIIKKSEDDQNNGILRRVVWIIDFQIIHKYLKCFRNYS